MQWEGIMKKQYIIAIDQSTQGTKALVLDANGSMLGRCDLPHKQIVNELGWVEHDPEEIYHNTIQVVKSVIQKLGIEKNEITAIGISNQRETALAWEMDGTPIYNAIVWQCARAKELCNRMETKEVSALIKEHTGLPLSPYFSAAKIAWILENIEGARDKAEAGKLCYGTVDTFLVYRLTKGSSYKTEYSNASRTQLFNVSTLCWDEEICQLFGIPSKNLAKVIDSNGYFGETDLDGFLEQPIPIHGVMGDSHGALFGQGCIAPGMIKATFGTGSSVMMNIGEEPKFSQHGLVTSLAWSIDGKVNYVLEGNVNYTGAVITWLEKELHLVASAGETEALAKNSNPEDQTYFVPAFTGLGAPYWESNARGIITGITRTTGQKEMVRAALDAIAYQITDILKSMKQDAKLDISELRVDGGPTKNQYLMQMQSDLADVLVQVSQMEELSGIGVGYAAGIGTGLYSMEELYRHAKRMAYYPKMDKEKRVQKLQGWRNAIHLVIGECNGVYDNDRTMGCV